MTTGAYSDGTVFKKGKSRYNELNIKVSTIEIVHRLLEADLIGFQKGFEGSPEWQGYISRIWPTDKLTKLFENAAFGEFDIGNTDNRETIILRDEEKDEVEYTDKTYIRQMRLAVQQYNKLLEKTFIDIQSVDKPARIELPQGTRRRRTNRRVFVNITHHDKFVRRIFNNKSFSDGGRFYGGWWQSIPSKYRKFISLNGDLTIEMDYSSIHIHLLYAELQSHCPHKDHYVFGKLTKAFRPVTKTLMMILINASSEKAALASAEKQGLFDDGLPKGIETPQDYLEEIYLHHEPIKEFFGTGYGVKLQFKDSQIA